MEGGRKEEWVMKEGRMGDEGRMLKGGRNEVPSLFSSSLSSHLKGRKEGRN